MPENTPQLSPNYWNDISRYCGEILVGVEVEKLSLGFFIVRNAERKAVWPAENNPETSSVQLLKGTNFLLGEFKIHHYRVLSIYTPSAEPGIRNEHDISFDPRRQKITEVSHASEFKPPQFDPTKQDPIQASIDFINYLRARSQQRNVARELGKLIPKPEDYDILHSELRHGAVLRKAGQI